MEKSQENRELAARLRALGVMLKIGRDMNDAQDLAAAAAIAANSCEVLLHFRSAFIAEFGAGKVSIAGQYGVFEPDPHSDPAGNVCRICREITSLEPGKCRILKNGGDEELSGPAREALSSLTEGTGELAVIKLPCPGFVKNADTAFFWIIDFPGPVPGYALPTINLLAGSIGASLFAHRFGGFSSAGRIGRQISKRKIYFLIAAVIAGIMFIPVREQINAEFLLRAPEITSSYALFDGPVAECLKQDGETVKAGEIVARYDTSQLRFRLDSARSRLAEIQKEYELENSASFSDRSRLGRVPLLAAKLDGARVDVKEAMWYLTHAEIPAPASGVLALADGRAELLKNRVLRTGDRIFDIYGGSGMVAEIRVNERDSSILLSDIDVSCFLYTQPETEIRTRVIDVRQYPERTEQNVWCYKVLARIEDKMPLRYGMRGIAKLRGRRVTLGYMLFKNAVLYLRWL
ncbi:MAG: hypothetical protein IJS01_13895 [Lentisphaeria bacterium]|nr:hypothetical protein [Lentisphaeria bacterium]